MRAAVRSACVTAVAGLVSALLVAPLTATSVHATAPAAGPHEASGPAFRAPHPVDPSVRSYAVRGASDRALRTLSSAKTAHSDNLAALSDPRPASGFAVTGVTWTGRAPAGLSLAIRTRTDGAWSRWTPMEYDAEHGPSPTSAEARKAKPGTDPFVVGAVDDVQLKVTSDTGRAPTGPHARRRRPGNLGGRREPRADHARRGSRDRGPVAGEVHQSCEHAGRRPLGHADAEHLLPRGLGRRRTAARLLRRVRRGPCRLRPPHRQRQRLLPPRGAGDPARHLRVPHAEPWLARHRLQLS